MPLLPGGPHPSLTSVPQKGTGAHRRAPIPPTAPSQPQPLPVLPPVFQPAVIVWARIHLQHHLHGEPSPAWGLRGPRAALSCPPGWGARAPARQGCGLRPPPPGPACLRPACCRSLGSSLKMDGPGRGGSSCPPPGPQRGCPALSCRALPPAAAALPIAAVTSPAGSSYCNQCHWLHLPFQCPCWGLQ